ncbi:MAG: phosphoglycolate phosphatase [Pseudomonadota bacterium]
MPPRLAVFDLDGTLIDTAPDLIETTNHVLAETGFAPVPEATLRRHIGLGARSMIASAIRENGADPQTHDLAALTTQFIAHYQTRLSRRSKPFAEIAAALPALAAEGVRLAVCTNKREGLARQLLTELQMLDTFAHITGGDTFAFMKPDPRHLTETIDGAGGTAENTVFVGDSRIDFETARAAKIPFVGLSYGYTDVPMADLGPDRLCEPGNDIAAAILSLYA